MNILIAPGAFKHSLSAADVAQAIAYGLRRSGLAAALHLLPIADGGNGTLDAYLANGGERIFVTVEDPLGRPIQAAYGVLPDGRTAVIEMALASGLELLRHNELDPLAASTYGTGQLLSAAMKWGLKYFILGLGGSATVDGGAGCLQALGVGLKDVSGQPIPRGGGGLAHLHSIDLSTFDPAWLDCTFILASDVSNPALGAEGAAAVFGPQKGATPEMVAQLEANLAHFFGMIHAQRGVDVRSAAGGGAAGAFAAGMLAFVNAHITPGIDLLLRHNHFVEHLREAHLVITGEGQMDAQTVYGKGPMGVAQLAREYGVPTVAIVGGLNVDDAVLHDAGIQAVLPIIPHPMPLDAALADAAALVERAALRLGYLLQLHPAARDASAKGASDIGGGLSADTVLGEF